MEAVTAASSSGAKPSRSGTKTTKEASLKSAGHSRSSKPCSFYFHSVMGCPKGEDCTFSHDEDHLKRGKEEKRSKEDKKHGTKEKHSKKRKAVTSTSAEVPATSSMDDSGAASARGMSDIVPVTTLLNGDVLRELAKEPDATSSSEDTMEVQAVPKARQMGLLESVEDSPDAVAVDCGGDTLHCQELCDLPFPVALADPSQPGCPIVLHSADLAKFLQISADDIVGKSWPQLLNSDSSGLDQCRALCDAATQGTYFTPARALGAMSALALPEGEAVCAVTSAAGPPAVTSCSLHLKQLELDDSMFVLGVLARLESSGHEMEENLSKTMAVLAKNFWLSAPMRRQVAEDS